MPRIWMKTLLNLFRINFRFFSMFDFLQWSWLKVLNEGIFIQIKITAIIVFSSFVTMKIAVSVS